MTTLFVRHKVKEFGAWKKAYEAFDSERKKMGVTGHGAYKAEGNPNDVTVYHTFENMTAAKKFADSPRLKEVMEKAGVTGTPEMWFTEPI